MLFFSLITVASNPAQMSFQHRRPTTFFFFYFQSLHFEIFSDSCPSHLALLAHTIALKFSTQRRRLHRTMVINQCANG